MAAVIVDELLDLLKNDKLKTEVTSQSWEYLLGLTASEEGLDVLLYNKNVVPFLVGQLQLKDNRKETLKLAAKCLVNVSSNSAGASVLVSFKNDLVLKLLEKISDIKCLCIEEICYMLSNISTYCDMFSEERISTQLINLLDCVWLGYDNVEPEIRQKYKFIALFLANISRVVDGRRLLLESKDFLKQFIRHIRSDETDVRRLGVALTLRNLCLETGKHEELLKDFDILPVLLLPLMGPEEYDEEQMDKFPVDCQYLESSKEREKVPQTRKALVQALSLLCYSEYGWNFLKDCGVYAIARELHLWEPDEDTKEAVETLVGFMLVLNYTDAERLPDISSVLPAETDFLKDIPDFLV